MRDNPWHLRQPTTEHYQWYRNLVELHELTDTWLKQFNTDRPAYLLTRGLSHEIIDNIWILESISKIDLELLIDDTSIEDMLGRLEHTIWAVQAWTLNALMDRATQDNRDALQSLLDQSSWKLGKESVVNRWKKLANQKQKDLRTILLCLKDSPFAGYPHQDGFLIKRAIASDVQIELRSCPHQSPYQEVKYVADQLCHLHTQWMRGFAYELNSRIQIEHLIQTHESNVRCVHQWGLI